MHVKLLSPFVATAYYHAFEKCRFIGILLSPKASEANP